MNPNPEEGEPNAPWGVEEDVLNPEKGDAPCEGLLSVDFAAVPKEKPATAVDLVTWVFPEESFVPSFSNLEEVDVEEGKG